LVLTALGAAVFEGAGPLVNAACLREATGILAAPSEMGAGRRAGRSPPQRRSVAALMISYPKQRQSPSQETPKKNNVENPTQ
jgi:hypothetical protein